jgi:small subunit ribosomal protein S13
MPRIIGTDIPNDKRLVVALTYIYGVGQVRAQEICEQLGLDPSMRAVNLSEEDKARINSLLQSKYVVEGDLRRQRQNDVKRLVSINCYRGLRHRSGLPVRGQRTRTNSRTRKGKKRTVAGRKK